MRSLIQSIRVFLFCALAILASAAQAAEFSPKHKECMGKADGDPRLMTGCYILETEVQDKRLNDIYNNLVEVAEQDQALRLRAAQREWIRSRDSSCALVPVFYSGAMRRDVSVPQCLAYKTAEQAAFLEGLFVETEE